ncbi:hypothetical protein D3C87_1984730 [compost metagenome]
MCHVGEMEHIVKAIPVRVGAIVRQAIANVDSSQTLNDVRRATVLWNDFDVVHLEFAGELLEFQYAVVEKRQVHRFFAWPSGLNFSYVGLGDGSQLLLEECREHR